MAVPSSRARRLGAMLLVLALSVALHAWMVLALDGRLSASRPAAPEPPVVEVALTAPPAPPAPAAAAPRAAEAPRAARPRPRPAPPPAESSAPASLAEPAPAGPTDLAAGPDASAAPAPEAPAPTASAAPPVEMPATPAEPPPAEAPPAVAPAGPPLPPLPAARRQRFKVYYGDFTSGVSVARLEYRLDHDGERYEVRTSGEAEGLISLVYSGTLVQASRGRVGPAGLMPLRYAEQRGNRPERSVEMDPTAGTLNPGGQPPVPMPAGTQDRLSVFYQLGLLARAEPERFVAGAVREMPIASFRDVRVERFVVVGDEILMAPGGPIRALRLFRPPLPGTSDPRIDLWLGYDHDMLPVRLRIEDTSQRVLDQVLDPNG